MANAPRKLTQDNYNAIRDHLFDRIHKSGEEVKNHFPNLLRAAIEAEAWKHFADAEGKPFKNLVDWLHSTWPSGAGMGQGKHAISYSEALEFTKAVAQDVYQALHRDSPSKKLREQNATSPPPARFKPSRITRVQEANPAAFNQYLFGQISQAAAAKVALVTRERPRQNLARAKSAFRKMSAAERADFLKWMKTAE